MSNMMTSGLTFALLSADSHAKMSTKPINMASTELKMREPNMNLVNRTMSYGTKELSKSDKASDLAAKELERAKEIAKAEQKAEDEARIEKSRQETKLENEKLNEVVSKNNNNVNTTDTVVTTDVTTDATPPVNTDNVEISAEVLAQLASIDVPKIATDTPKIYSENMSAIKLNTSPARPKLDIRA